MDPLPAVAFLPEVRVSSVFTFTVCFSVCMFDHNIFTTLEQPFASPAPSVCLGFVYFISCRILLLNISYIITEAVLRVCVRVPSQILHPTCSAYISWNNGRILMFKVSKWPYRSSRNDEIICRWRHNPPGGKIWTKQPWVKIKFCATFIAISRYL